MKKSTLERLNEAGLWNGPKDYVKDKLRYAYQLANHRAFIGVFEKGTFRSYPDYDSGNSSLYLGVPCDLFSPVVGRDKIRDSAGELKTIENASEVASIPSKKKGIGVKVRDSAETLIAYPLDWSRQAGIVEASSFDGYEVLLVGMGPLGLEVAHALMKMGVTRLNVHDTDWVSPEELAVGSYRIFDANRLRVNAAYEYLADQTMNEIRPVELENFDPLVINTLPSLRKKIWEGVKGKTGLLLDVFVDGLKARIFAINPADSVSAELYTSAFPDLYEGSVSGKDGVCVNYFAKTLAGLMAGMFQRYVASPGAERANCLDRMYAIDLPSFYRDAGCWGKTRP